MKVEVDKASVNKVKMLMAGLTTGSPKALMRSLNATASKGKTESNKAIRTQVNLSAAYIRDRLEVKKATTGNLTAKIITPSRGLMLVYYLYGVNAVNPDTGRASYGALLKYKKGFFSVANLDQPLKVKIKPNSSPISLGPEWFILPKLKNSNLPALAKRENGRLRLHGPSLSQVFTDVKDDLAQSLSEYQVEQFNKKLDDILRGY